MYPEFQLIQIVELPKNGDTSPYAVRQFARMEYFNFDFMCKNSLKKFFIEHHMENGEYLIIRENDRLGDKFIIEAICIFRAKESGNFVDFKRPGEKWIELVREVMEEIEIIPIGLRIQTMQKMSIPKIGAEIQDVALED
ncbi:MAG: hypothetical protein ACOYBE_09720 [Blautia sp.]|jgi:hypothetical protein